MFAIACKRNFYVEDVPVFFLGISSAKIRNVTQKQILKLRSIFLNHIFIVGENQVIN